MGSATRTYKNKGLTPYRDPQDARRIQVIFAASAGVIAKGTVLGVVTATGKFAAYNGAAVNGTETARAILEHDVYVDANGDHYLSDTAAVSDNGAKMVGVPAFVAGSFLTTELVGLDAAAIAELQGSLVTGTVADGVLRIG